MANEFHGWVDWTRDRKLVVTLLITLTLVVGILIGTVISGRVTAERQQSGGNGNGAVALAIPDPAQLSSSFAAIVTRLEPAVVNISTAQLVERPRRRAPQRPQQQDPFRDFFDRFFDMPEQGAQASRSLGSGFIVDKKGYILTNNHVIEQATKIQVKLQGDTTLYTAKVVGSDAETDLAVIKIDAKRDLAVAKLGNSESVRVGDWVLAFGSPFQLDSTVTAGIVSAKDRSGVTAQQFQRFIQTDAAINRGNSGGPLVNMAAEVIGINTAIFTATGGFQGVGFALPSNTAIGVYNQLVEFGKVTRGSIGITFDEERSQNPITLHALGADYGMVVESVVAGGPAERGGLKAGDVITKVNGNPVRSSSDLVDPIAQSPIGSTVRLTVVRERKTLELSVIVEDRTKIFPELAGRAATPQGEAVPAQLGLRVEDLTAQTAKQLGFESAAGAVVVEVEATSFGEDIGFARGDLIAEVNGEAVRSAADYRRLVAQLKPGQNVVFRVMRRVSDPRAGERTLNLFLAGVVPEPE